MKIEVLREKFNNVIARSNKITQKNTGLPVLSCFLLNAENGQLSIYATNLDFGLEWNIPAKIEKKGNVAVYGNILANFMQHTQNEKVISMASDGKYLTIQTNTKKTNLKILPGDEFPTIPKIYSEISLEIPIKKFVSGIKSVLFSSSNSNIKPELASIYIYINDKNIVFVATDGFRLAEKRIYLNKEVNFDPVLIPTKNAGDLIHVFEDIEGDMKIISGKNQIGFYCNEIYATSRIIEGVFPDYHQLIPSEFKTETTILRHDILNALKISSLFSDEFNQVKFTVYPDKNFLKINSSNNDKGNHIEYVTANVSGENIETSFNNKYITECLLFMNSESVSLQYNDPSRPIVMRGINDNSFLYLVMPMRQ